MKQIKNLFGFAAVALAIVVSMAGCKNPLDDAGPTSITIAALQGITAPITGAAPVTAITSTKQYTGTVTWSPAHNSFKAATVYTATITLKAKDGYTLKGVAVNFFKVEGATTTNAANSGVVTAVFPSTAGTTENIITGEGNEGGSGEGENSENGGSENGNSGGGSQSGGGGSGGGGGGENDTTPTFTSVSEFAAYLAGKSANTAGTSYRVKLNIQNEDMEDLKTLLLATNKYVYLDLSDSAITEIPEGAFINNDIDSEIDIEDIFNDFNDVNKFIDFLDFLVNNVIKRGCAALAGITIPNSLTSIGITAFTGCSNLTAINVAAGNDAYTAQDGVLYNKSKTTLIAYPTGKTGAFTIPNGVTSIEVGAFAYCFGLTSVTIPNGVTNIGLGAFVGCTRLTSITISNSVTSIGELAFFLCTRLTSITIPNGVTSIEQNTFQHCIGLTSVTIPNSVTSIGDYAFVGCIGLTSITIPNSVTSIGDYAFNSCIGLTSITIPNSVTSIGEWAFSGCTSLASITIPNRVTSIEQSTFQGCSGLTSVTIPNSVTSIEGQAFDGCTSLTSVSIPNSVTSIENLVFNGCTSLTAINVAAGNSAYSSQDGVLYNKAKTRLVVYPCGKKGSFTIPDSVTDIEDDAFRGCTSLTAINVTAGNSRYSSQDGVLYDKYKTTLITYPAGKTGAFITPNSVTSIGQKAFAYSSLTSVTIGNSITSIGSGAFAYSSLTSVTIGNSITSIGSGAFVECDNLTSVTFERADTHLDVFWVGDKDGLHTRYPFPGDLGEKYLVGGIGTYTRPNSDSKVWTKQSP